MVQLSKVVTGLAALAVGQLGATHLVEFNDQFMQALQAQHLDLSDMLPDRLLAQPEVGFPACDVDENKLDENEADKTVHVLLTFSTCISQDQLNTINQWVESIKTQETQYFQNGHTMKIVFDSTLIPGACQDQTERQKKGLNAVPNDVPNGAGNIVQKNLEGEEPAQFGQVAQRQLEAEFIHTRLAAFEAHGTVLAGLPTKESEIPLAVFSFVNDIHSFQEVTGYERQYQIEYSKTFQLCKGVTTCEGFSPNCIPLTQDYDLFMYNPFAISRRFHCQASLPGGIPVSYSTGTERKCYCTCPLGTKGIKGTDGKYKCVATTEPTNPPILPWDDAPYQVDIKTKPDKCIFNKFYSSGYIDAPFPFDNYVADNRINADDTAMVKLDSPRIELSYRLNKDGAKPVMRTFTWSDYQKNYKTYLDAMEFTQFGRYDLELDAFNYIGQAKSTACLAITDSSRPVSSLSATCPKIFCDSTGNICEDYSLGNAEYTPANVQKFLDAIKQFYAYQTSAVNDPCSMNNRCDVETLVINDFYKSQKTVPFKSAPDAITTFAADFFAKGSKTFENPIKDINAQPNVLDYAKTCTRCLSMYVALKEKYMTYNCLGKKEEERCDGQAGQECKLEQCLAVYGDTFVDANVKIDADVSAKSQQVIDGLVQKGYNTITQVHVALECEDFGAKDQGSCDFSTTMNALLRRTVTGKNGVPAGVDPNSFVFWRYKVEEKGKFFDFNDNVKHTFTTAQSTITVEAWTQCGKVRDMFFYVHLHTASKVTVCDKFDGMWYQTTISHATLDTKAELCNYPHTDFVELTFDYHPNIGIGSDINQLGLQVTGVECSMTLNSPTASQLAPKKTSAVVLKNTNKSPEIVERFAIELLNTATTDRKTKIDITCTFSYSNTAQQKKVKTCATSFIAKSCNDPILGLPDAENLYKCAGKNQPGPFEACGGNVVKSDTTKTYLDADDHPCCDLATGQKSTCSAVIGLPTGQRDIKYCVPTTLQNKPYFEQTVKLLETDKMTLNASQVNLAGLSLVGAIAGVVLMVAVRRRRNVQDPMPQFDSYHPLLD